METPQNGENSKAEKTLKNDEIFELQKEKDDEKDWRKKAAIAARIISIKMDDY